MGYFDQAVQSYQIGEEKKNSNSLLSGLVHVVGGALIGLAFPPAGVSMAAGAAIGGAGALVGELAPDKLKQYAPMVTQFVTKKLGSYKPTGMPGVSNAEFIGLGVDDVPGMTDQQGFEDSAWRNALNRGGYPAAMGGR